MQTNFLLMADWDSVSFVIRSTYRKKVLMALKANKSTPSNLSDELDISSSHVSRALTELREEELVERLVDNPKGRIYGLTDKGKDITEKIEKEDLDN